MARLAVVVFAPVGDAQDRPELFEAGGLDELRRVAVVDSDRRRACVAVRRARFWKPPKVGQDVCRCQVTALL
jgi:hypothetical protein